MPNNLNVKQRLHLAFGALLVMLVVVLAIALAGFHAAAGDASTLADERVKGLLTGDLHTYEAVLGVVVLAFLGLGGWLAFTLAQVPEQCQII